MNWINKISKLIIGISLTVSYCYSEEFETVKMGDIAPTFFLRTIDGEGFFLSKQLGSKGSIVLAFYATWCVPCRSEIPALEKLMVDTALADIRLYYVNIGGLLAAENGGEVTIQKEEIGKVLKHKEHFKMTHPILRDRFAVVAKKFGAESLPTIVVIGSDGIIKYIHRGYSPGDELTLKSALVLSD
jgi:thiol-disulfide isomerase/thioredoxin